MLDRLDDFEREHLELQAQLADPALAADQRRYTDATRRYKELTALVECGQDLRKATEDLAVAREMYAEASADDRELLKAEIDEAEADIARLDGGIL